MILEDLLFSFGAEIIHYEKNEILFREGDFPLYYFQIRKGSVKLNNYDEHGKEFIQHIASAGESFGESNLFIDQPYPVNALSIEKSIIIRSTKSGFLKLINTHPDILSNINQYLAERMYDTYIRLYNLSFQHSIDKLKLFLDYLKRPHNDTTLYSFQIPMTRQQLASLTGLCVETVIRTIKHMEKKEMVRIQNGKIFY
ncbi:Crp/Fnr family transcriptional regulator [Chryseobacterium sp. SIMBA_029]|uniref:Crp/Fnr family transcriptional regulator n=1 Tax=Chryseobacterium sp. SIMBA_029 TaxID=3085772 RepID=UPI00397B81DC